ncbi:hypothetical protein O1L60_04485 [Streptomyces diastatochromogenes]|nr:hypothetical protein [Streptomyces diastatochromogenes]
MRKWFDGFKKRYKRLLLLAVTVMMVGLLKGAATAAGEDIYAMVCSKYG